MYTGIVQGKFPVVELSSQPGLLSIVVELSAELMNELLIGASVGVDGVCLSVTAIAGQQVHFDIMQQTLNLTALGKLEVGCEVNVERSAKQGVEVGGHILSGHIDCTADVVAIENPENNRFVTYGLPAHLMKYVFEALSYPASDIFMAMSE